MRGNLLLLLAALLWGSAFVAQRLGLDHMGSFAFNGVRTLVGALAIFPVSIGSRKRAGIKGIPKMTLVGGVVCGLVVCVASNLQQAGIAHTSVSKAGFITALYILFVPLIGLLLGKHVSKHFWIAVGIAMVGMYFLTSAGQNHEGFSLSKGDFLVLLSAIMFAVHIMVIDHYSPMADGPTMALLQFLVSGTISVIVALCVGESVGPTAIKGAIGAILYSGILSCGAGYTLQIVAQKDVNPVIGSLLMSLESVFAALAGWLVLHEQSTGMQVLGCALVFAAIIMAQLPGRKKS